MQSDSIQTVMRLEASLVDTAGESSAVLRQELEAGGVDVTGFLDRLHKVVRKGYQFQMRQQGVQTGERANSALGSLFGDLSGLGSEQLRSLIQQVLGGAFGGIAQSAARCRNYQGEQLSDEDIRSWLRDVEKLSKK